VIAEIGILIGFYVLTRIIPSERRKLSTLVSMATALVAAVVIVDLGLRGIGDRSLVSIMSIKSSSTSDIKSGKSSKPTLESNASVTRADGGSISTNLGYGFIVAKGSSLRREWIAIHDPSIPVVLEGTPGITTVYVAERYSGSFRYRTKLKITAKQSIAAMEIRFLTFDVWGNHVRTLRLDEVADLAEGVSKDLDGSWSLYSENDVEKHYASIAYVARVRLKDGRVLVANEKPVLDEARKFSEKFSSEDLEPRAAAQNGKDSKKKENDK
jgi:hypothetical protein